MIVCSDSNLEDVPPNQRCPGQDGKRPDIAVMEQWQLTWFIPKRRRSNRMSATICRSGEAG